MKQASYVPVVVNGKTVRLRGYVDLETGARSFEDVVRHGQVAELAGMTVLGSRVSISYADTRGTRGLAEGESFWPEADGRFTVTYT